LDGVLFHSSKALFFIPSVWGGLSNFPMSDQKPSEVVTDEFPIRTQRHPGPTILAARGSRHHGYLRRGVIEGTIFTMPHFGNRKKPMYNISAKLPCYNTGFYFSVVPLTVA